MKAVGKIEIIDRVRCEGDECWGKCVVEGNRFTINIARKATNDPILYADTMLHELLHLWLFMLEGSNKKFGMSQRKHHALMKIVIPVALNVLKLDLWNKFRKGA